MFDTRRKLADLRSYLSARDGRHIARATLLVIGTIGLLFPVIFALILTQGRQGTEFGENLGRSFERRVLIGDLSEALQEAEINHLVYLLRGDPEALKSYQTAYDAVSGHLDALVKNGVSLRPGMQILRKLIEDRLAELHLAITVYQFVGSDQALRTVHGRTGKIRVDEIRSLIERTRAEEVQTGRRLSENLRRQAHMWETITLTLLTGMVIAMIVASTAVARDLRRRRGVEKELKAAQQLAQQARDVAERASAAKTDFLATMSHEIRTPLSGVIGYTELLHESRGLTREQRSYVDHIQNAGYALLALVNDVLDFSRVEAGEVLLVAEPFSLPKLVDNAVSIVRAAARKKALPIRVEAGQDVPECLLGDVGRLRQILLNLLNNAVKFTDKGNITLRIENTGTSDEGDRIRFSVIDTGPGIALDQQRKLFKRFAQLDHPAGRRMGGAGLGLAISKRFVELMGGEIGVESEEGKGSTFWFVVPLPRAETAARHVSEADNPHVSIGTGRILVVDDLDQNRELAQAMLRATGHIVDTAKDGAEAVTAVQTRRYDLVLMDVEMADTDGVTAARMIRSLDHPARNVPIIAMTANVLPQDIREFRAAGMNDHLAKPYTRAQLLEKVDAVLVAAAVTAGEPEMDGVSQGSDQPDSIESLCQFMGREWVARGLTELKEQLESTFLEGDPETIESEQLARKAHVMVSRSSIFGFSDFAHLCVRLEEACKAREELSGVFQVVRVAADDVHARVCEMLNRVNAHTV
ncbi:hybrid sensor histidine kinase/response regulator [Microvirga makkahensis]|uniref:histidine kinase n=1 Tax=Microvirga makkahensis TaxID=1128670 RepID=A0A7X3MP89_9HYPH|nr:ATP-binding protein [Microvirga makkahensis]MXQ10679.1 response regulator [Microvirga makkahensis]